MKLIQKEKTNQLLLEFDVNGIIGIQQISKEFDKQSEQTITYYNQMCRNFIVAERPFRGEFVHPWAQEISLKYP